MALQQTQQQSLQFLVAKQKLSTSLETDLTAKKLVFMNILDS